MQRPWRPYEPFDLQPAEMAAAAQVTRDRFNGYSIEFLSLGFEPAGDYRITQAGQSHFVRYFLSSDGAVFCFLNDETADEMGFEFGSVLADGTWLRSVPTAPQPPWNCCRFPVHVNFGSDCGLEELLVKHLLLLSELEPGCGHAIRYRAEQLPEVARYTDQLRHETIHAIGAPLNPLPIPQSQSASALASS